MHECQSSKPLCETFEIRYEMDATTVAHICCLHALQFCMPELLLCLSITGIMNNCRIYLDIYCRKMLPTRTITPPPPPPPPHTHTHTHPHTPPHPHTHPHPHPTPPHPTHTHTPLPGWRQEYMQQIQPFTWWIRIGNTKCIVIISRHCAAVGNRSVFVEKHRCKYANAVTVNARNYLKTVIATAWLHVSCHCPMYGSMFRNNGEVTIKCSQQIPIIVHGKQIKLNWQCLEEAVFEKCKLFTRVTLTNCKHANAILDYLSSLNSLKFAFSGILKVAFKRNSGTFFM